MRRLGFAALLFAIGISPRIPLGIPVPDRRFEIRFEDVLLALLLVAWLVRLMLRARLHFPWLFKPVAVYAAIAAITSGIAIITMNVSVIAPVAYLGKEVQFILFALLLANWVRTPGDLRLACGVLLGVAVLNAAWIGVQAATLDFGPLLTVERELAIDVYQNPALLESYGPTLLAEASPLATGTYFMFSMLLCLSLWVFAPAGRARTRFGLLAGLFSACLAASFSRISILGAGVGAVVLATRADPRTRFRIGLVALVLVGAVVGALAGLGFLAESDRLTPAGIVRAIGARAFPVWEPQLERGLDRALIGFGKGSLGNVPGLETGEAHNHYLRIFLETGVFGLTAFLAMLGTVILFAARLVNRAADPMARTVAGATLAATLALCAAAVFQDAFLPVMVNEYWWGLIGLTAAAHRMAAAAEPMVAAGAVPAPNLV